MPTPHIESNLEDIAPLVIMPGDPKRAEFIAKSFLKDVKLVNNVRNITAYTGTYKTKKVTVFPSGMGMPSMGIYAYELFNDYNVEVIIRVGTCGSYSKDLKIYDILVANQAYSETNFDLELMGENFNVVNTSIEINTKIMEIAKNLGIEVKTGKVHTTDSFYSTTGNYEKYLNTYNCLAVEMETFALGLLAKNFHKKCASILTVSDELYSKKEISSKERETKLLQTIKLSLETIINF